MTPDILRKLADLLARIGVQPGYLTVCHVSGLDPMVTLSYRDDDALDRAASAMGLTLEPVFHGGSTWERASVDLDWCRLELTGPHTRVTDGAGRDADLGPAAGDLEAL
jgi:hypothetical protein